MLELNVVFLEVVFMVFVRVLFVLEIELCIDLVILVVLFVVM